MIFTLQSKAIPTSTSSPTCAIYAPTTFMMKDEWIIYEYHRAYPILHFQDKIQNWIKPVFALIDPFTQDISTGTTYQTNN